ncbi:hypothetical protein [Salipiger marinus]|uniref:Uncharacterized protein n=1 Tax=Salipiger marinus TaxID=555512 RepID=A0A1G8PU08_9RHOB|nr:hypothetical protein [Salipiger marinus]SDI95912.1 hypothetical protein SAMN04487993_1013115 [Salipiger marinus]
MKFDVLRAHQGDKWYGVGDTRDAREVEVQQLVDRGVLRKAAPDVLNKAAPPVQNKGVSAPKHKASK